MDGDSIYCLIVKGTRLDDAARNVLFDSAQQMIRKGRTRQKIKGEAFEGLVTTEGKTASLPGVSGILFSGHLETEFLKTDVQYIVRPSDLKSEDGEWTCLSDLE